MTSWRKLLPYLRYLKRQAETAQRGINRLKHEKDKIIATHNNLEAQCQLLSQQILFYQQEGRISYQTILENRRKMAVILSQRKQLHQQKEALKKRQILIDEEIEKQRVVIKKINKKQYKVELTLQQQRGKHALMLALSNETDTQERATYG